MRRKIPPTTALIGFEAAARHQSFTKAAEELALTQSAICRQIASLESSLGVKLFRRTRRGVQLTEAGRQYGRRIVVRLDELERDTLAVMGQHGPGQTLELAVVPTFATRWLLPRLKHFHEAHPDITVNLTNRTRPFLFADTDFDAAIYFGDGAWPGTRTIALMHEEPVPVCSPALIAPQRGQTPVGGLTPEQIAGHRLLQQTTRPYAWREWFDSLGMRVDQDMSGPRYELFTMLAEAAMQEMGIALIPPFLIRDELASGRLVVPFQHSYRTTKAYQFVLPETRTDDPLPRLFGGWLEAEMARYQQGSLG